MLVNVKENGVDGKAEILAIYVSFGYYEYICK